jgi:ferrous iron transport protein B
MMWERSSLFLKEAGTVILACTIVLWALLSFPRADASHPATTASAQESSTTASAQESSTTTTEAGPTEAPKPTSAQAKAAALEKSYAGRMGKALEPAIRPLGFDWRIGVGLIGAFAAREVFVSTMGLVYGVGAGDDDVAPLRERIRSERSANGRPLYTPLVGLSLMVFFAFACQCMSTLAVVRRETKSWRWPAFLFGYMTAFAYAMSLLVYKGGKLLGFG